MRIKTVLPLGVAERIVDEALGAGRAQRFMPLTVVVLSAGGQIVCCKSEDGSGIMRFEIARGKAWGALSCRRLPVGRLAMERNICPSW